MKLFTNILLASAAITTGTSALAYNLGVVNNSDFLVKYEIISKSAVSEIVIKGCFSPEPASSNTIITKANIEEYDTFYVSKISLFDKAEPCEEIEGKPSKPPLAEIELPTGYCSVSYMDIASLKGSDFAFIFEGKEVEQPLHGPSTRPFSFTCEVGLYISLVD